MVVYEHAPVAEQPTDRVHESLVDRPLMKPKAEVAKAPTGVREAPQLDAVRD
jgi:hypothetical protein